MKKLSIILISLLFALLLMSCMGYTEINLEDYVVVIPKNADLSTKYCADNFICSLKELTGVELPLRTDDCPEIETEILIGETNREASKTTKELNDKEYTLLKKDKKLVFKGKGIYIGSAVGAFLDDYLKISGSKVYEKAPSREKVMTYKAPKTCENIIFMIGDGMGVNHISLAENNGLTEFVARQFPNSGMSITRSQSVINKEASFTDSSASATAMATGYKTLNGYVGIDSYGASVPNIRELAHSLGYKTGVITTDLITGATPSSYLCHASSREDTSELQAQIDKLIEENKIDYIVGEVDNDLTFHTKNALYSLSEENSKFFLMIEEAKIDKASHAKDLSYAIETVIRYNDAIAYATQFTLMHSDTAIIVTADHETGHLNPSKFTTEGFRFLSYNHTNDDVPVFALGAGTEVFNSTTVENTYLYSYCYSKIKK